MQESGSNGNEGTTIDELSHLNITENLINPIKEAFKAHMEELKMSKDKVKMGLVEKMEANLILAVNKTHKQNIDIINEKYTALDLQYKNFKKEQEGYMSKMLEQLDKKINAKPSTPRGEAHTTTPDRKHEQEIKRLNDTVNKLV